MEEIPRGDAHMAKASSVHPYERGQWTGIEDGSRRQPAHKSGFPRSTLGESEDRARERRADGSYR
jgi:hypothetical protein